MRKVHVHVMVTLLGCCVINYCHGMAIREKIAVHKQLTAITSGRLTIPSFDQAWQLILKQQAIPRAWENYEISSLATELCNKIPDSNEALRQHVLARLPELEAVIPTSTVAIRKRLENPELVHNLQLWADFITQTKRILAGLKGESDRRIRAVNGSLEYQHISPWRERWDLLQQCAALAVTLKSEPSVSNAAGQVVSPFNDAEARWAKTIVEDNNGMVSFTNAIYGTIKKLDDTVMWDQSVQTAPENNSIVSDFLKKVDEARESNRNLHREWSYYGEHPDIQTALSVIGERMVHFSLTAKTILAAEFAGKAAASAINSICEHLAAPAERRNYEGLATLQKQLALILGHIQPLSGGNTTEKISVYVGYTRDYITMLAPILERLQETGRMRRAPQPGTNYYPAPTQQVPYDLSTIIAQQQEMIMSLIASQKAQQEQINELLKRLPSKY